MPSFIGRPSTEELAQPLLLYGQVTTPRTPPRLVAAIGEPWLSHMVSGAKTYEGRLCGSPWAELPRGSAVELLNERYKRVRMIVVDVVQFGGQDFDAAFDVLGDRLLPGVRTREEALQIYRDIYSEDRVRNAGGVVAVQLALGDVEFCQALSVGEQSARVIETMEDLCLALFQVFKTYKHGFPLDQVYYMIETIADRTVDNEGLQAITGCRKLKAIFRAEPLSMSFEVKGGRHREKYLCLRNPEGFDERSGRAIDFTYLAIQSIQDPHAVRVTGSGMRHDSNPC